MAKRTVFVREATGLIKNVGFLDAVSLNMASMSVGLALATIGYTMALLPSISGVNLIYASVIGFVFSVPQMIVYTMMITRMPRTAGDYVWISRSLNGRFAAALALMGGAGGSGQAAAFTALTVLATTFSIGSFGVFLGYQSMMGLSLPGNISGSNPILQVIVGIAIFIALIFVVIVKPKAGYKMMSLLIAIGIVTMILAMVVLVTAGVQGTQTYLESLGANLTYTAVASSYTGPSFALGPNLFILPFFAIYVFPWINGGATVASEIKGKSTLKWNVLIGAVLSMGLMTAGFAAMYYAGGFEFTNAALANATLVYNYSFNFWTWAMGVSSTPVIGWLIGIGEIAWNLAVMMQAIVIFSRYIFAFAFDRFLPAKFAYVSSHGSPVYAHLLQLILAVIFVGIGALLYGPFSSLYGAVLSGVIYFLFVGVAALVYGMRQEKGSARVVLAISGAAMALVYLFLSYEFLEYPSVWGGNTLAYFYIAISFVIGLIVYQLSKSYHMRQGIDIDLAFKQIPPE